MTTHDDDPLTLLEEQARKQRLETEGAKAMSSARSRLVLKAGTDPTRAFFAGPALKLKARPDWSLDTATTDGKELLYNPGWFAGLKPEEQLGIVVHEAFHPMLGHHARREGRDPSLWNVAADLAVNPLMTKAGFVLPSGRLMPGEGPYKDLPPELSAEDYYSRLLQKKPPSQGGGNGNGDGPSGGGQPYPDPGGCGGVKDPGDGSEADCRQSEAEWQVAAAQAQQVAQQVARQSKGTLPAWLQRMVSELLAPKVDWRDVLRNFVSCHARNDYSWQALNRRFIHQNIYLPGLRSDELGHVVCAVDTSGSVDQALLTRFASEMQGILDVYDARLTIVYCDAAINGVEEWTPSDGPLQLKALGGGGTSHVPVFRWLDEQEDQPVCVVCLTDLYTSFPSKAPDVPVLWCVAGGNPTIPPFGMKVEVKE